MPENPTTVLGVGFDGRVTTAAGGAEPGEADGTGPEVKANTHFSLTTDRTGGGRGAGGIPVA